jgi:hypothetical protein
MDPFERDRLDRMNREAEPEKAPEAPQPPVDGGDSKPLIVMICAALTASVLVLGIMWVNDTRHADGSPTAVAEQPQR